MGILKWWQYAIAIAVIFAIGSAGGYRIGQTFQKASDAGVVESAQQAVANHNADIAAAEKAVREQVSQEKDQELAAYKAREAYAQLLYADAVKQNATLSTKLATQQQFINEAASHDKASGDFLNSRIPDYLRNHGVPAETAGPKVGVPGNGGH